MIDLIGDILYEDNQVLVAVKPPNMLSQADRTGDPDILSVLKNYIKEKYHKPGNVYLGLVHRLDRPVGGLMVFARTSKAAARLDAQLREHDYGRLLRFQGLAQLKDLPGIRRRVGHVDARHRRRHTDQSKMLHRRKYSGFAQGLQTMSYPSQKKASGSGWQL